MVKYVPDKTGRFSKRPHYEPLELDRECEAIVAKFLKSKYGKAEYPISTDDLTILMEQNVADFDPYADLSAYGSGVEGITHFRPGKKPVVKIAANLSESDTRENRLRTTLTHEFGHVRFHAYLWEIEPPASDLLRKDPHRDKIICKRDGIINAAMTDWMEWQAGYACGALLMPLSHLRNVVRTYHEPNGIFGSVAATSQHGQALIDLVATTFQVSRDAARVRLLKQNHLGGAETPSLFG